MTSPRPSRPRPSRSSSRAATSSPRPRPAPARPRRSPCRSSTGSGSTRTPVLARPPPRPRRSILVPTRELAHAGRRERPHLRPDRARSAPPSSTAGCRWTPRPRPSGAASRSSSRRPAACSISSARRSRTSARSRSSSSTRPTGCSTWASCPTSADHRPAPAQAPEPHVLGHVLGRHPAPVEHDPARPGRGRGRAAQHGRRGDPPARLPGRPRPQGRAARPPDPEPGPAPGARVHPDEDRRHAASRRGSTGRASNAVAIHSDRTQPERTRALEEFKTGEIRVLVATDVAARGLDIEDLPHVVNFELPWNPQDYIHRIGRTGPRRRRRATRSASSASTRPTSCAASSASCAGRSPGRSRPASSRTATSSRDRCAAGSTARPGSGPRAGSRPGHHPHRKPVQYRAGARLPRHRSGRRDLR